MLTDTTEGEYRVVVEGGSGMSLGPKVDIAATWTARIYFVRASDGVGEHAWTGSSYWQRDDPNKRRTRAKANVTLGRLRSHLARTGSRWEVERDRERREKEAARKAERERLERMRKAAEPMFAALNVVALTPKVRKYLKRADPMALKQVDAALKLANEGSPS